MSDNTIQFSLYIPTDALVLINRNVLRIHNWEAHNMNRDNQPHIEVDHTDNRVSAQAVAFTYDMDSGPLSMPEHIKIGQLTWDRQKITCFEDQVSEYDVWLEDQIKNENQKVLSALDHIYNKAISSGVVLTTRCCPSPYRTHAHIVRKTILNLVS